MSLAFVLNKWGNWGGKMSKVVRFFLYCSYTFLFLACSSNLSYTPTAPQSSLLREVAEVAGVDELALKESVNALVGRGGLFSLSGVDNPEDFPILACVADTLHDGSLSLSDIVLMAGQVDKTCAQIAEEAESDPETDNDINCVNLDRDDNHLVNMDDVAVFALLLQEHPEFSTNLCHNPEAGDADQLAPYTEAIAWVNTDPLKSETFGMEDYDYYLSLLGSSGGEGIEILSLNSTQLSRDGSYVISGRGFGVKFPVEPLKFDTFDYGSEQLGEVIDESAVGRISWSLEARCAWPGIDTPDYAMRYSDAFGRYEGDVVGWKFFGDNPEHDCYQGTNYLSLRDSNGFDEIYFSMWALSTTNGAFENMRNVKIANFANYEGNGFPQGRWDFYPENGSGNGHMYIADGEEAVVYNEWSGMGYSGFSFGEASWDRYEGVIRSGDVGVANGGYTLAKNGEILKDSMGSMLRPNASSEKFDTINFTHYLDDVTSAPPRPQADIYHSEFYVDITQARIELCDSPDRDLASHCEIQEPHSVWNESTIHFNARFGSFAPGQTLYLIVFDAQGNTSNGFPVYLQ